MHVYTGDGASGTLRSYPELARHRATRELRVLVALLETASEVATAWLKKHVDCDCQWCAEMPYVAGLVRDVESAEWLLHTQAGMIGGMLIGNDRSRPFTDLPSALRHVGRLARLAERQPAEPHGTTGASPAVVASSTVPASLPR